jgi:hypothetical protein
MVLPKQREPAPQVRPVQEAALLFLPVRFPKTEEPVQEQQGLLQEQLQLSRARGRILPQEAPVAAVEQVSLRLLLQPGLCPALFLSRQRPFCAVWIFRYFVLRLCSFLQIPALSFPAAIPALQGEAAQPALSFSL